ncbi:MAG: hypothetical protein GWM98_24655 [Nitrospinaceae bacterium]|nr:hypothetical protein [Nitrospinaceae bacterium]NIT84378.1 hypothetical protein [Nitrospinaceae bacterium]NIW61306.1 hypothetical protein [Nitrospinaceae bacterium]NIY17830.1 hypothetical protein [Nitrospinaceae bacterium]
MGGPTLAAFLMWIFFTALFYLVCYLAALNTLDHLTRNSILKIPALLALSPIVAFIISIFHYNPLILFFLMLISNYFRVKNLGGSEDKRFEGLTLNKPLFFTASYLYIIAVYALAAWFQNPVELNGTTQPYWQTWFPELPGE